MARYNVLTLMGTSKEKIGVWFLNVFNGLSQPCRRFPRNIIEVHRDLERHKDKHVSLEQFHLLKYPSYEYFFVSPDNPPSRID